MDKILIIPARIGSKRIPEKNIKSFHGKPIIAYSIEAAIESGIFNEVMVSTDSIKVKEIAESYGARVPFLRSHKNANDHAGLADVLIEVIKNYSIKFDIVCCLLPTAPFINASRLKEAYALMSVENLDAVISVQAFRYPIDRALHLEDNKVEMIHIENYQKRSQDLRPAFHDAGQFYFIKSKTLLSEKILFPKNCHAIILDEYEAHDIDTGLDWTMAELKYKMLLDS